MAEAENKGIAQRYFSELMNQGRLEIIDEIFTEDCQFHITTIPVPVPTRDGMRQFTNTLRGAFPDIRFEVEHMIAEGDKVLARWRLSGTHSAPFLGIPATGARVNDHGNDIFHFRNGQIKEVWVNEDSLHLMRQLGAIPS